MIYEFFGLNLSDRTVNRYRNELQLKFRSTLPSVFLTENAIVKRKNCTQFHIDNLTHWRDVAFSDESWFLLGSNKKWVWIDKNKLNDKMYSHRQAHPPKVMVWGAIGWNFKSELVIIDYTVNTQNYIDHIILESNFIQDADRCWGIRK